MLCPYCLEREADTQDHVVPEGLFDVAESGGSLSGGKIKHGQVGPQPADYRG